MCRSHRPQLAIRRLEIADAGLSQIRQDILVVCSRDQRCYKREFEEKLPEIAHRESDEPEQYQCNLYIGSRMDANFHMLHGLASMHPLCQSGQALHMLRVDISSAVVLLPPCKLRAANVNQKLQDNLLPSIATPNLPTDKVK